MGPNWGSGTLTPDTQGGESRNQSTGVDRQNTHNANLDESKIDSRKNIKARELHDLNTRSKN
jgi:hypothetical protein